MFIGAETGTFLFYHEGRKMTGTLRKCGIGAFRALQIIVGMLFLASAIYVGTLVLSWDQDEGTFSYLYLGYFSSVSPPDGWRPE